MIPQECEIVDVINTPEQMLQRVNRFQPAETKTIQVQNLAKTFRNNTPARTSHIQVASKLSPKQIQLDCCHTCKIIFHRTIDYLKHKYKLHRTTYRLKKSRYRSCPNCKKTFITRPALKNHSKVCRFRQLNKYQCSGCSKMFTNYNVLKQHEKLCFVPELIGKQQFRKIFLCDHCGNKFNTKSLLAQHKLQHCYFGK